MQQETPISRKGSIMSNFTQKGQQISPKKQLKFPEITQQEQKNVLNQKRNSLLKKSQSQAIYNPQSPNNQMTNFQKYSMLSNQKGKEVNRSYSTKNLSYQQLQQERYQEHLEEQIGGSKSTLSNIYGRMSSEADLNLSMNSKKLSVRDIYYNSSELQGIQQKIINDMKEDTDLKKQMSRKQKAKHGSLINIDTSRQATPITLQSLRNLEPSSCNNRKNYGRYLPQIKQSSTPNSFQNLDFQTSGKIRISQSQDKKSKFKNAISRFKSNFDNDQEVEGFHDTGENSIEQIEQDEEQKQNNKYNKNTLKIASKMLKKFKHLPDSEENRNERELKLDKSKVNKPRQQIVQLESRLPSTNRQYRLDKNEEPIQIMQRGDQKIKYLRRVTEFTEENCVQMSESFQYKMTQDRVNIKPLRKIVKEYSTTQNLELFIHSYQHFISYCVQQLLVANGCEITLPENYITRPQDFSALKIHPKLEVFMREKIEQFYESFKIKKIYQFQKSQLTKLMKIVDQISEKYLINSNILFQIGGSQKFKVYSEDFFQDLLLKYPKINRTILPIIQMQMEELLDLDSSVTPEDKIKKIQPLQQIVNQYLIIKKGYGSDQFQKVDIRMSTDQISEVKFLVYKTLQFNEVPNYSILKFLEVIEKFRYQFFYQLYGIFPGELEQLEDEILDVMKKQMVFLAYFHKPTKSQIRSFLKYTFQTFLGINTLSIYVRQIEQAYLQKPPDFQFWTVLELILVQFLRQLKAIHYSVMKDIESMFMRVKRIQGSVMNFRDIFKNLKIIMNEFQDWLAIQEKNNTIFPESTELKNYALNCDFLSFYLNILLSTTDSYSVHDIKYYAFQMNIQKEIFQFWLKGLKIVLLKQKYQVSYIQEFIEFVNKQFLIGFNL